MSEQERLAQEGYRIRCYVPYGTMWYPYYTRRLAEKVSQPLDGAQKHVSLTV